MDNHNLLIISLNLLTLLFIYIRDFLKFRYKKLVLCLIGLALLIGVMLPAILPETFQ